MSRRVIIHAAAVLACCTAALAPLVGAAAADATSGGTSPSSGGAGASAGAGRSSTDQAGRGSSPAAGMVTASGGGITFSTHGTGMLYRGLTFSGNVAGARGGIRVEVQRRGRLTNGRWVDTAHGTTNSSGDFVATWPANHIGRFAVRAVVVSGRASRAAAASPAVTITVYRSAVATIYGPGFYGSRTACGMTLRPSTIGVANRTLPCGTSVSILYRGRTMVVPVIDRGPYANGADWDLTEATAHALEMDGTARIGAVSVPKSA